MKKNILYLTLGPALMLALATLSSPARADVTVTATIDKKVAIRVIENIIIRKWISIDVEQTFNVDGTAEAEALANVVNTGSTVDGQDVAPSGDFTDFEMQLHALIDGGTGSLKGNTGVIGVNQDVGNMVNQGNIVVVTGIRDLPAFVDSQAEVDQINTFNSVTDFEGVVLPGETRPSEGDPNALNLFDVRKTARILNSIQNNSGVVNVNQNSGNMNNQTNAVAMAIGFGAVLALSESALGQENSNNFIKEVETVKLGLIRNSINNNSGVVNVNQSTGNMNNQATALSFSALTSAAVITTPNGGI
jgi:hypothetical protein